jgi:hypothetical protein
MFGEFEYYRCPTTGEILESLPGDDKVLCGCGKSNPKIKTREATFGSGGVVHIVSFLEKVPDREAAEWQVKKYSKKETT